MNVLLVSPLPPPYGGIAHWTSILLDHAHKVEGAPKLTVLDTAPKRRRGLEVSIAHRMLQGISRMIVDNMRLCAKLTVERPDVVHINTSGQLAFFRDFGMALLLRVARTPFVYHLHFGRLPELHSRAGLEWWVARLVLRQAAAVIALDSRTARTLKSSSVCRRVVQIPNPIPDERALRCSVGSRRPVVFYAGWVIPAKGISELLEAWRAVGVKPWTLEIAGPADGEYMSALRCDLPPDVSFLGEIRNTEVIDRMRSSSIFAYPSHTEGFPNAVLEAMASGMAVLASDVGAIEEMIGDGAGRVVPPHDVEALTRELRSLMHSSEWVNTLGAKALGRVRERYVTSVVFGYYLSLWESVVTEGLVDRS